MAGEGAPQGKAELIQHIGGGEDREDQGGGCEGYLPRGEGVDRAHCGLEVIDHKGIKVQ